jgi:hypothetical protein
MENNPRGMRAIFRALIALDSNLRKEILGDMVALSGSRTPEKNQLLGNFGHC